MSDSLPHNIEAEQQLLGAILTRNDLHDMVADVLTPAQFYDPVHGEIYRVASNRIRRDHLASPITMASAMGEHPGLNELGGKAYLLRLASAAISIDEVREYARLIIEDAARRLIVQSADQCREAVRGGQGSQEAKSALLTALESLPEPAGSESTVSGMAAVTRALEVANHSWMGEHTFLRTGITALDKILVGLAPGDYMLLGGATSSGKTAAGVHIAQNVASQGHGVAFWSLEMTDDQLMARMAAAHGRFPYQEFRAPSSEEIMRKVVDSSRAVAELPIRIIPKHIRDVHAGMAAMRRARRETGVGLSLAIIDYAQLVRAPGKSRFEQMTEVSIASKTMAGLLGVPVIALVQLDRNIGGREDKRPQLNDIRESGQFENDADQAVFVHREQYWLERQGPGTDKSGTVTAELQADHEAELARWRNKMELIVRKNRHGPLGTAEVGFHAPSNRFWNLETPTMEMDL